MARGAAAKGLLRPWVSFVAAVALATGGVYFLLGGPWASSIGYEFAGPSRPVPGILMLAAAVAVLALDARRRRRMEGRTIVLYTREACSLCDEARALLAKLAEPAGFNVWEEDVDADPGLAAKYGDRVPVAVLDGEELFELRADVGKLRNRLGV